MRSLTARRRAVWFEMEERPPRFSIPPDTKYCPFCGQGFEVGERSVGYLLLSTYQMGDRYVDICPCGWRLDVSRMLPEPPAWVEAEQDRHEDNETRWAGQQGIA